MGVVYVIRCTESDKIYVGYTTRSLKRRFWEHIHHAKNGHTSHLSRAIRKHGPQSFSIHVLFESNDIAQLLKMETEYIRELDSKNGGWNSTDGGEGVTGFHYTMSEQHKDKISESMRRKTGNPRRVKIIKKETKPKLDKHPVKCAYCGKIFSAYLIDKHVAKHKRQAEKRAKIKAEREAMTICSECGRRYTDFSMHTLQFHAGVAGLKKWRQIKAESK